MYFENMTCKMTQHFIQKPENNNRIIVDSCIQLWKTNHFKLCLLENFDILFKIEVTLRSHIP